MVPLNTPLGDALIVVSLLVLLLFPLPGWAETWKEAYQKGLDLMAAQRWEEAARAFDRAIQGNPREDGTVRLYGMRYGYFPYRDKGIALYRFGRSEPAVQALEESLRQGFSEEGVRYLEQARKHLSALPGGAEPWKDAYLRGRDFLMAQQWDEAVQAFDQAIQGNPHESSTVHLYGMRYGYFPYRDKGIALYRLGRWEPAVQALEESLRQGFSEEGARYLEQARKRQPRVELPRTFAGRWWDYYERGLLYRDRGIWDAAIKDFQAALKGRSREDPFARTYGVHFIQYFPLRESGVALYHNGQYTAAVQVLERSLAAIPSAKTAYYLNLARGARLRQSGADAHPPRITLTAPQDGLLTNRTALEVRGTADSQNFVATVAINGEPILLETTAVHVPFAVTIPLVSGPNVIEVVARDLVGYENKATVRVVVDREGPAVALEQVVRIDNRRLRLDGTAYDNSRLAWLQIDGRRVPLSGPVESRFSEVVELVSGGDKVLVEAADAVGNLTRARISPSKARRQHGSRQGTQAVPVAWPMPGLPFFSRPEPPTIDVESVPTEVQDEEIPMAWTVTAAAGLSTVTINGVVPTTFRQTEASKSQILNQSIRLWEGENVITIRATDRLGRTAEKTLTVVRKIAEVNQLSSRLRVFVQPFEYIGEVSGPYRVIYQAFENELVNRQRFQMVDRVTLDSILKELKLSQTELMEPTTAVRVGRMAAAEALLGGTISEYGSGSTRGVEVWVKLSDTETSTILGTANIFDHDPSLYSFRQKIRELAQKLQQDYPVAEGPVLDVLHGRVAAGLGSRHRVRPDMRVIVYLEGAPLIDPQTHVKLGQYIDQLAEGRLSEVQAQISFCCAAKGDVLGLVQRHVKEGRTVKVITK